jgi:hypothetical protein
VERHEARSRQLGTDAVAGQIDCVAIRGRLLVRLLGAVEQAPPLPMNGASRKLPYLLPPPVPLTWVWLNPMIRPSGLYPDETGSAKSKSVVSGLGRAKPNGTLGPGTVLPPPAVPTSGSTSARRLAAPALSALPSQPEARRAATRTALGRAVAQEPIESMAVRLQGKTATEPAGVTERPAHPGHARLRENRHHDCPGPHLQGANAAYIAPLAAASSPFLARGVVE